MYTMCEYQTGMKLPVRVGTPPETKGPSLITAGTLSSPLVWRFPKHTLSLCPFPHPTHGLVIPKGTVLVFCTQPRAPEVYMSSKNVRASQGQRPSQLPWEVSQSRDSVSQLKPEFVASRQHVSHFVFSLTMQD